VDDCTGRLIVPGFVDAHVHFVQTDIVAAYGRRLLEWLEQYTFPAERAFADERHASEVAEFFLDELLRNGTTTALILGSVHAASVNAIFRAAHARRLRLIAGKVMMDRNCPDYLRDTPASSYADSKALIARWHGKDRLGYAITPRFAPRPHPSSSESRARSHANIPACACHTHVAENEEEVAWVRKLFPDSRSYLDVYDRAGLLRAPAVLAHGIWLDDRIDARLAATACALAALPDLQSRHGQRLFDLARTSAAGVRVAARHGHRRRHQFSLLRVMQEAYKVAQLRGHSPLAAARLLSRHAGRRARARLDARSAISCPARKPTSSCSIRPRRRCSSAGCGSRATSRSGCPC
jgi:guanine deaminase